jgi:hypothetical protein
MSPIRRFGPLNRLSHPASMLPDEALTLAVNLDGFKAGQVSPRDGLQRPEAWTGCFFTAAGEIRGKETKATSFGDAVRSLIPADTSRKAAPELDFDEEDF